MTFTQRGGGVERKAKIEDVCGCSKGGGGWVELICVDAVIQKKQ